MITIFSLKPSKAIRLLLMVLFVGTMANAQVANYIFSESPGTYTPLGVPTTAIASGWDDEVTSNAIPIGFTFNFNNVDYSVCSINSNGYITFGTTLSANDEFNPISSGTTYSGVISALGIDIIDDNLMPITYKTTGVAPNRVFTVQWSQIKRFVRGGQFNFQIQLNETTNIVSIVYGACLPNGTDTQALNVQVGLRGATNSDYNNRSLTANGVWDGNTVTGVANTATCRTRNGTRPTSGITFRWTPRPVITSFTPASGCSNTSSVVITGTNFTGVTAVRFGGTDAASYVVNTSTQITAIPAAGTSGSISVMTSGGTATSGSNFVVTPTLSAPSIGTITQPTCSTATGSVVLNGLPSGPWILTRTPDNVTATGTGTSTTISGLNAGTYTYVVNGLSNGLKGEYFNNMTLSGPPTLTRTDATLGFNWGTASPDVSINTNNFSVRWSGLVQPLYSEIYTFSTSSDDGIRLWVNGVQIINNWTDHGEAINTGTIALTAGVKYSIVLEFYENGGDAISKLSWSSPTNPISVTIPTERLFLVGSCGSPASANVVINAQPGTPVAPTGAASQSFCSSNNPTVASLVATGTAIKWYSSASVGTALATTTSLGNGTHYFASQTVGGCESTTRLDVTATVKAAPIVYAITGSGNFCASSTGNLIGLSDSEMGVSYQLVRNSVNVGSVVAGTDNSISFGLQNSAGDYTVVATKNSTFCSVTMTGVVTISSLPPVPVGTSIVDTSCSTSTGSITLTNQNHGLEFVKTTSQYISTTAPFLSNLAAFTMEGWIKFKTSDLNMGLTSLFGQNDVIEFGFQGGQLHLYTLNGGNIYVTPPANLGGNTWHHIAAVGTGSQILIYVDGIVVGSGGYATSNYGSYTDNVNIGAGVFNPTGDFFAGQIMKVGFYNTALSGTRIASLAYSPITYTGTETGLIAGYNFLEGSGTTLTSLPASKNGTLVNVPIWRDPYIYSWTKTGTPTYAATTRNVTGLSSGSYNLSFDIGKGCSRTVSYSVGTLEATWNGASWSSSPTVNHNLIFNGNYLPAANPKVDINGCSCTVNTGKNVTINPGHNLILSGDLTVLGTLTFENNASLVQTNNTAVNTGDIIYKRQTSSIRNTDYTYWSSPVAGHTLDISTSYGGGMFYSFNDFAIPEAWLEESSSSNMKVGKGYIIRGPEISSPPLSPPPPPGMCMATFTGVPNNGIKDIAIGPTGNSNLIGNPYPSAIYADRFLFDNQSVIEGTIYFWTHNTPIAIGTPDPGTGVWAYSGNDYATYTLTGGTGTAKGSLSPEWVDADKDRVVDPSEFRDKNGNGTLDTSEWTDSNSNKTLETNEWTDTNKNNIAETEEWTDSNKNGILDSGEWTDLNSNSIKDFGEWTDTNGNGVFNTGEWTDTNGDKRLNLEVVQVSNKPTGKIAAGQGFFTTSITTGGTVTFANEMRVDGSGNPLNNTFFYKIKNSKAKTNNSIEKNRVWLNLTNTQGAFKQALVGYITGATNTWDNLYDGESFDGNNFLDFYSINDEKNLTIQGRALPFDENDEIPLGYRIAVEGTFTIGIDESDGKLENQPIFIEDKLTNTVFDLKRGKYTFKTVAGTFNDRFILRYTNKTLGTNENELAKNKIIVSVKKKQIKIDSFAETIDKISIYDLLGRKIYQKDKVNSNQFIITDLVSRQEIFIVKTTLLNGNSVSNKIIY